MSGVTSASASPYDFPLPYADEDMPPDFLDVLMQTRAEREPAAAFLAPSPATPSTTLPPPVPGETGVPSIPALPRLPPALTLPLLLRGDTMVPSYSIPGRPGLSGQMTEDGQHLTISRSTGWFGSTPLTTLTIDRDASGRPTGTVSDGQGHVLGRIEGDTLELTPDAQAALQATASGAPPSAADTQQDECRQVPAAYAGPTRNGQPIDPSALNALQPNSTYTANGYQFRTDAEDRIVEADGDLHFGYAARDLYRQRTVGGADRLPTDDGGHLIANQFEGPGQLVNLVPQDSDLNRNVGGPWRQLQAQLAQQIQGCHQVFLDVRPVYDGTSQRPVSFEVTYRIDDGKTERKTFMNRPGG